MGKKKLTIFRFLFFFFFCLLFVIHCFFTSLKNTTKPYNIAFYGFRVLLMLINSSQRKKTCYCCISGAVSAKLVATFVTKSINKFLFCRLFSQACRIYKTLKNEGERALKKQKKTFWTFKKGELCVNKILKLHKGKEKGYKRTRHNESIA